MSGRPLFHVFYDDPDDLESGKAALCLRVGHLREVCPALLLLNLAAGETPSEQLDLLIVENDPADIRNLIQAAQKCEDVQSLGICHSGGSLLRLLRLLESPPKVMTLDFALEGRGERELREEWVQPTAQILSRINENDAWSDTVVIGITRFARHELSDEVRRIIRSRGDIVRQKCPALWDLLPDILWDAFAQHKLRREKGSLVQALTALQEHVVRTAGKEVPGEELLQQLLIGCSREIAEVRRLAAAYGQSNDHVFISGESGVGKRLVALGIHKVRGIGPFVERGAACFTDSMVNAELFGQEKGDASGIESRPSVFELAEDGTLFFDDIDDMPASVQSRLLKVIEERRFLNRQGKEVRVECRFIWASNKNMRDLAEQGAFRRDLWYRVSVLPLHVPPLRERPDDIPVLFDHFLQREAAERKKKPPEVLPEVYPLLKSVAWGNNVRGILHLCIRLLEVGHSPITPEGVKKHLTESETRLPSSLGRGLPGEARFHTASKNAGDGRVLKSPERPADKMWESFRQGNPFVRVTDDGETLEMIGVNGRMSPRRVAGGNPYTEWIKFLKDPNLARVCTIRLMLEAKARDPGIKGTDLLALGFVIPERRLASLRVTISKGHNLVPGIAIEGVVRGEYDDLLRAYFSGLPASGCLCDLLRSAVQSAQTEGSVVPPVGELFDLLFAS